MHRPQHKQAPAPAGDHVASLQEPALHRGALCGESQRGRLCERGASRRHGDGQLQDGCLQRLEHGALLVCKAVGLKGNPVSPMAKKSVTKAVKKNKGGGSKA